ncbi:endonuclease domain-containing protein [Streptomyces sp. NPDC029674]|uniref:endonuclease domain-containing protein n=1 Tax=Streptomyces sp. NPDC029674 TaxID=3365297 RepID=UPI00384E3ABF
MFEWQKARCAICGRTGQRGGLNQRTLVLDHDHHNGLVRGFLCHRCNKVEGLGRTLDGRFTNYRRWPPRGFCRSLFPTLHRGGALLVRG